jgi:hypothetical protein
MILLLLLISMMLQLAGAMKLAGIEVNAGGWGEESYEHGSGGRGLRRVCGECSSAFGLML